MNDKIPSLLLSGFLIKLCIFNASFPDAFILWALALLSAYSLYHKAHQPLPLNDKAVEDIKYLAAEIDNVKASLNSIKLGVMRR